MTGPVRIFKTGCIHAIANEQTLGTCETLAAKNVDQGGMWDTLGSQHKSGEDTLDIRI